MQGRLLIGMAGAAALLGCGGNPSIDSLTSEQRAKLVSMEVFRSAPAIQYETIDQVTGLSCHRNAYQVANVTEEEAIEGVKIRAAQLGADAVVNTVCQTRSNVDMANNCFSSIKCVGDAIRIKR